MFDVTYQDMLDMLTDLDEQFTEYDSRIKEIMRVSGQEEDRIKKEHGYKAEELKNTAENAKKEARKRRESWKKKVSDCRIRIEETHNRIRKALSCAATVAITADMVENQDKEEEDSVTILQQESQMLREQQQKDDTADLLRMHEGARCIYQKLQELIKKT